MLAISDFAIEYSLILPLHFTQRHTCRYKAALIIEMLQYMTNIMLMPPFWRMPAISLAQYPCAHRSGAPPMLARGAQMTFFTMIFLRYVDAGKVRIPQQRTRVRRHFCLFCLHLRLSGEYYFRARCA